ncbi:MAG: hypothetical protein HZB72_01425 [Burkholderiales bacterium]|nr:hypothetical protein [Burkholderiales bacterium]
MTRKPRWEDDLLTWREHVPEPAPPDPPAAGSTTSAAAPPPTPPIWWPDDPVRPPAAARPAVPPPAASPAPSVRHMWWPDDLEHPDIGSFGVPTLLPQPYRVYRCLKEMGWPVARELASPLYFDRGKLPLMEPAVRASLPSLLPDVPRLGRLLREMGWPRPQGYSRPAVPWAPPEPFGPPKPDAALLHRRIPTVTARLVAGHLRWLAQALIVRGTDAAPLDHGELSAVLGMLGPAQILAVADALLARLTPRLQHRLHEEVPALHRRRSVHSGGWVLAHHERDRDLYTCQKLLKARQERWGPGYELALGVSRQPDGAQRLTPDCAPRLLELAECVEAVAGLPPEPARPRVRGNRSLMVIVNVIADHIQWRGDALHEVLLTGQLTEVHIDLLQRTVTPDPAPHRSMPWVQRLADWLQEPHIHRDHGWHIAQAHLRRAPGSPTDLLLQVTLETWQGARHAQQERRFRPW